MYGLSACSAHVEPNSAIKPIRAVDNIQDIHSDVNRPFIVRPTIQNFSICHGHSCNKFAFLSLSSEQWQSIKTLFIPAAKNAQQEREHIKQALALFEKFTGKQAGTHKDKALNNVGYGLNGQLDCIDEATNSTVYLRLLYNEGLLHFHQQASRTSRGGLLSPHNTATIIETNSNIRYAVDSWFYDNGEQPVIIPIEQWKSGWKPTK